MAPPGLGRHIALIGFMGAGKSTVGQEVARRLGLPFLDSDAELERITGSTIAELFADEEHFRKIEEQFVFNEIVHHEPAVVALGGGAILSEQNREILREHAFTVLLDVDLDVAWGRAAGSGRPLASDEESFRRLYAERAGLYAESAHAGASDADGVVLAAAGVAMSPLDMLSYQVPGHGPIGLVTEPRVNGIHGAQAQLALGARLMETHELPTGEDAKSVTALERLWEELRLDRGGTIVALGGGCVTDAAGFAAATYLRGVPWVAVPTTLVGQVDAAIGGKTAINLAAGKNLAGAFHWPERTVIDPELLLTLPERERREGMAEVVKTGLLAGEPLWALPEPELVRRCVAFKAAICLRDPHEHGPRAVLNLGHTFAHALEAAGPVSHGSAVALGMVAALRLSGNGEGVATVEEVLGPKPVRVDRERAWAALQRDKKGGRLVLLPEAGRPELAEVPDEDVRAALDALIEG